MDRPLSPEEFLQAMRMVEKMHHDPESFHSHADDLICILLRSLGYGEAVEIFENHDKWYS